MRTCLLGLALLLAVGGVPPASANIVVGNLQGVFPGNDSVAQILIDLGLEVILLAKVDDPDSMNDGLTLSNIVMEESEPKSGQWDFAGPEIVDLLVVKAGNDYAAYLYHAIISGSMPNTGLWNTLDLGNKGMSHISAYSIVPEPATAVFLSFGLLFN